jgi:hypothetical protein
MVQCAEPWSATQVGATAPPRVSWMIRWPMLPTSSCPSVPKANFAGPPLAHPLTQTYHLPLSPVLLAYAAAALVVGVALFVPQGAPPSGDRRRPEVASWAGSLSAPQVATRTLAVALLALTIAAGRVGTDDELENLAPAFAVGAMWPLLVVASVVVGPVWRWVDPWDAIARVLARGDDSEPAGHVGPAAFVALASVWYLSVYAHPLAPRSVGAALAVYTVVSVAGCLAVGRVRWLSMAEPFGIVLSWVALVPRRGLADWTPPRGALALLGVLTGGLLFGAVRRSELWGDLNTEPHAELLATAGLIVACAAVCGFMALVASVATRPARRALLRAMVPAVAGIVLAVAMESNRLTTSVQLLPGLLGDPFGSGWDLLGRAGAGLDPAPFDISGLLAIQLAALVAGFLAGAIVLARRVARQGRTPLAGGLSLLAGASVIALASH